MPKRKPYKVIEAYAVARLACGHMITAQMQPIGTMMYAIPADGKHCNQCEELAAPADDRGASPGSQETAAPRPRE